MKAINKTAGALIRNLVQALGADFDVAIKEAIKQENDHRSIADEGGFYRMSDLDLLEGVPGQRDVFKASADLAYYFTRKVIRGNSPSVARKLLRGVSQPDIWSEAHRLVTMRVKKLTRVRPS